jgi:membrane protease YdiL (CAAX protease family)
MPAAAIDWGKLLELVWASAVAGIAVAIVFALLILGATRASDHRRTGESTAATAYLTLAVLAALAFAGGVVFGISVTVSK